MKNAKIEYMTSATRIEECPKGNVPEIALCGRSNAGKSSFLNALSGQLVAKVSGKPGKTRLLNFFSAGPDYRFVDMPGYGYSARSGDEQMTWHKMIEHYMCNRPQFAGALIIMDIRRDWQEDEALLRDFVWKLKRPVAVIATKADKLGRSDLLKRVKALQEQTDGLMLFPISSLKRTGIEALEEHIFHEWIKPGLGK